MVIRGFVLLPHRASPLMSPPSEKEKGAWPGYERGEEENKTKRKVPQKRQNDAVNPRTGRKQLPQNKRHKPHPYLRPHYFFFSSMSSPISPGLRGSTYAVTLSSFPLDPTVTQTCFCGIDTPTVSRYPSHRNLPSLLMSLFPSPPPATHSATTVRMKATLRRKSFAAGTP